MVRIVQKKARTKISSWIVIIATLLVSIALFQIVLANNFGVNALANLRVWSTGTPNGQNFTIGNAQSSKNIDYWNFNFYTNFTNSTGIVINSSNGEGNCDIRFNITGSYSPWYSMTYNTTNNLYYFNSSFIYKGNIGYQFNCTSTYGNVSINDYIFVRNTPLYVDPIIPINLNSWEDNISTFLINYSQYILEDDKNDLLTYSIENISSSSYPNNNDPSFYSWITINPNNGIINSSAILENQTGNFFINIRTSDTGNTGADGAVVIKGVNLNIQSINDAPIFTNLNNMTMTEKIPFEFIINTSDEENNYPLAFNISFLSCTVMEYSQRNCSTAIGKKLFNYTTNGANGIINISFLPTKDDVGNFTINFSVSDTNNYELPYNASYSKVVEFRILNNNTDPTFTYSCNNERNWNEGQTLNCQINVSDVDEFNNLTLTTFSNITGESVPYSAINNNWFVFDNGLNTETKTVNTSTNHKATFNVNVPLTSRNVGNWSINLTLSDNGVPAGVNQTTIFMNVGHINHSVSLGSLNNLTLFTSNNYTIEVNASDDDILIPDKREYNESLQFSSNTSWVSSTSSNFLPGTNKMNTRIFINPGLAGNGNFIIKINVTDSNGFSYDEKTFRVIIFQNAPPIWNSSNYTYNLVEGSNISLPINLSKFVSDSDDGNNLNFSFNIDNLLETSFPDFRLDPITGIINFTPDDYDVGRHNLTINVTDPKGASTSAKFYFVVNNTNDAPNIISLGTGSNYTWNSSTRMLILTEDNYVDIQYLMISDDDYLINASQKASFYNENLSLITNITNRTGGLNYMFNFDYLFGPFQSKINYYGANFTPRKKDVGNFSVNLIVTDKSGLNNSFGFNLTVIETQHPPNITSLWQNEFNLSYLDPFTLNVNASDLEDGDKIAGFLNFSITPLNGGSFLSINSTSGMIINRSKLVTGIWNFSISVEDRTGLNDTKTIVLFVYDNPVIDWPLNDTVFNNFYENSTNIFNIRVNHSLQNNLVFSTYINGTLRNQSNGPGNGVYYNISLVTNFVDETTCSGIVNLTVNVSNPKLSAIQTWNLSILHTNYPVSSIADIGGADHFINVTNTLTDDLTDYFYDLDSEDDCVNQHLGFVPNFLGGDNILVNIENITNKSGGHVTFAYGSVDHAIANYSITAYEYNESNESQIVGNVTSNNFTIELTKIMDVNNQTIPQNTGGGGSSRTTTIEQPVYRPISFKMILPDPISAEKKDKLILPIYLVNTGGFVLNGIMLDSNVVKNGSVVNGIITSFSNNNFTILGPNQSISLNLSVDLNSDLTGSFEININATVRSPSYSDWGKIYLTVKEGSNIDEKVIFTEELIAKNPECAEIKELVDDAKKTLKSGNLSDAEVKIDAAVSACKEAITQKSKISLSPILGSFGITDYVLFASIASVTIGILFYFYKRIQLKKSFVLKDKDEMDF